MPKKRKSLWQLVTSISDKVYPRRVKKYPTEHRIANKFERLRFGVGNFRNLNKFIQKNIPKGQLAGDNTKRGIIKISATIPSKWRPEVAFHERVESNLLSGKKIVSWTGRGKTLRIRWKY